MSGLTHFDATGNAHMVDVSDKAVTSRVATAKGHIRMAPETLAMIARDLKVAAPPMDAELAKHAGADQCEPEV